MTLMAASRDASWYNYPDTTTVKVMHVARIYELNDKIWSARCNRNTLLDETVGRAAGQVPEGLRCQRRGCRELWPAGTRTRTGHGDRPARGQLRAARGPPGPGRGRGGPLRRRGTGQGATTHPGTTGPPRHDPRQHTWNTTGTRTLLRVRIDWTRSTVYERED